jgi:hypothetical protein
MTWQLRGNLAILSGLSASSKTIEKSGLEIGGSVYVKTEAHLCHDGDQGTGPDTRRDEIDERGSSRGQPGAKEVPERGQRVLASRSNRRVAAGVVYCNVLDPAEDSGWQMIATAGTEKNKLLKVSGWLGNRRARLSEHWLINVS